MPYSDSSTKTARGSLAITIMLTLACASLADRSATAGFRPVGGDIAPPESVSGCLEDVSYTVAARKALVEGVIILQADIDAQGEVSETRVLRGLGHGLDESASGALRACRFTPGYRRSTGEKLAVRYVLTKWFKLNATIQSSSTDTQARTVAPMAEPSLSPEVVTPSRQTASKPANIRTTSLTIGSRVRARVGGDESSIIGTITQIDGDRLTVAPDGEDRLYILPRANVEKLESRRPNHGLRNTAIIVGSATLAALIAMGSIGM